MTKYLIIGGTGTLGQELTRQLAEKDPTAQITIFSRDELKQAEMRAKFPMAKYIIGDIRDRFSVEKAMADYPNVVFHVAALKHVDAMEGNPEESVKTNVYGTMNVADMCRKYGVQNAVFSSTDKAVDPVNVYGMCKGISERIWRANGSATNFKVYRWGNVLGSRGSAIHTFAKSLKETQSVRLTHPEMTRFWIRIEDAVSFMLDTYRLPSDEAAIPCMKAAPVSKVIMSIGRALGLNTYEQIIVGLRPGEKIHEVLTSQHATGICSKTAEQYSDEEIDQMVREILCQC